MIAGMVSIPSLVTASGGLSFGWNVNNAGPWAAADLTNWVNNANGVVKPAGVRTMGTGQSVLALSLNIKPTEIGIVRGMTGTAALELTLQTGNARTYWAWTDISGDAVEVRDYTFAAENFGNNTKVANSGERTAGQTTATLNLPRSMLYDPATSRVATQVYILITNNNETFGLNDIRGGNGGGTAGGNNHALIRTAALSLTGVSAPRTSCINTCIAECVVCYPVDTTERLAINMNNPVFDVVATPPPAPISMSLGGASDNAAAWRIHAESGWYIGSVALSTSNIGMRFVQSDRPGATTGNWMLDMGSNNGTRIFGIDLETPIDLSSPGKYGMVFDYRVDPAHATNGQNTVIGFSDRLRGNGTPQTAGTVGTNATTGDIRITHNAINEGVGSFDPIITGLTPGTWYRLYALIETDGSDATVSWHAEEITASNQASLPAFEETLFSSSSPVDMRVGNATINSLSIMPGINNATATARNFFMQNLNLFEYDGTISTSHLRIDLQDPTKYPVTTPTATQMPIIANATAIMTAGLGGWYLQRGAAAAAVTLEDGAGVMSGNKVLNYPPANSGGRTLTMDLDIPIARDTGIYGMTMDLRAHSNTNNTTRFGFSDTVIGVLGTHPGNVNLEDNFAHLQITNNGAGTEANIRALSRIEGRTNNHEDFSAFGGARTNNTWTRIHAIIDTNTGRIRWYAGEITGTAADTATFAQFVTGNGMTSAMVTNTTEGFLTWGDSGRINSIAFQHGSGSAPAPLQIAAIDIFEVMGQPSAVCICDAEPEPTPAAGDLSFNFVTGTLRGLDVGARYTIEISAGGGSARTITVPANGQVPIIAEWFGQDVDIIKLGITGQFDSAPLEDFAIPSRPVPPAVGGGGIEGVPTTNGLFNGSIQNVTTAMQYILLPDTTTWHDVTAAPITDLKAGNYHFRIAATATAGTVTDGTTGTFASLQSGLVNVGASACEDCSFVWTVNTNTTTLQNDPSPGLGSNVTRTGTANSVVQLEIPASTFTEAQINGADEITFTIDFRPGTWSGSRRYWVWTNISGDGATATQRCRGLIGPNTTACTPCDQAGNDPVRADCPTRIVAPVTNYTFAQPTNQGARVLSSGTVAEFTTSVSVSIPANLLVTEAGAVATHIYVTVGNNNTNPHQAGSNRAGGLINPCDFNNANNGDGGGNESMRFGTTIMRTAPACTLCGTCQHSSHERPDGTNCDCPPVVHMFRVPLEKIPGEEWSSNRQGWQHDQIDSPHGGASTPEERRAAGLRYLVMEFDEEPEIFGLIVQGAQVDGRPAGTVTRSAMPDDRFSQTSTGGGTAGALATSISGWWSGNTDTMILNTTNRYGTAGAPVPIRTPSCAPSCTNPHKCVTDTTFQYVIDFGATQGSGHFSPRWARGWGDARNSFMWHPGFSRALIYGNFQFIFDVNPNNEENPIAFEDFIANIEEAYFVNMHPGRIPIVDEIPVGSPLAAPHPAMLTYDTTGLEDLKLYYDYTASAGLEAVRMQFRTSNSGPWTNIHPDFSVYNTAGSNRTGSRVIPLPAATYNQAILQIRWIPHGSWQQDQNNIDWSGNTFAVSNARLYTGIQFGEIPRPLSPMSTIGLVASPAGGIPQRQSSTVTNPVLTARDGAVAPNMGIRWSTSDNNVRVIADGAGGATVRALGQTPVAVIRASSVADPSIYTEFNVAVTAPTVTPDSRANFTVVNPYEGVNWSTWTQYKAAHHVHTENSDGAASTALMAERHYELGFHIVAFTDHDYFTVTPDTVDTGAMTTARVNEMRDSTVRTNANNEGMIFIPNANELSLGFSDITQRPTSHHLNVYWTEQNRSGSGQQLGAYLTTLRNWNTANSGSGIARLNHPGRYTGSLWPMQPYSDAAAIANDGANFMPYANLFRAHPALVGMEIINKFDTESQADRILWDNILSQLMPDIMADVEPLARKPVWGFSDDDSHSINAVGFSYNLMLMPELTLDEVNKSMVNGSFLAFSRVDRQYNVYPRLGGTIDEQTPGMGISRWDWDGGRGIPEVLELPTPVVNEISIEGNRIIIDAENYDYINWYADGIRIWEGDSLNLRARQLSVYSYVRATIVSHDYGVIYTQPFGIKIDISCEVGCVCYDCGDCDNCGFCDECAPDVCPDCGEAIGGEDLILDAIIGEYNDQEITLTWHDGDGYYDGQWEVDLRAAIVEAAGGASGFATILDRMGAENIQISAKITNIAGGTGVLADLDISHLGMHVYHEYNQPPWWTGGQNVSFEELDTVVTTSMNISGMRSRGTNAGSAITNGCRNFGLEISIEDELIAGGIADGATATISFVITDARVLGAAGCACDKGTTDCECGECSDCIDDIIVIRDGSSSAIANPRPTVCVNICGRCDICRGITGGGTPPGRQIDMSGRSPSLTGNPSPGDRRYEVIIWRW
jgi:hypothetical protein